MDDDDDDDDDDGGCVTWPVVVYTAGALARGLICCCASIFRAASRRLRQLSLKILEGIGQSRAVAEVAVLVADPRRCALICFAWL